MAFAVSISPEFLCWIQTKPSNHSALIRCPSFFRLSLLLKPYRTFMMMCCVFSVDKSGMPCFQNYSGVQVKPSRITDGAAAGLAWLVIARYTTFLQFTLLHASVCCPTHVFAPLQPSQQRKQYVWETSWDKVADSMTVFIIRYIKRPSAKSSYCSTDHSILSISLDRFHRIMYRTPTRGLWLMTRKRSKLMVRNPLNLQQIWEGKQLMMISHLLEIQWG